MAAVKRSRSTTNTTKANKLKNAKSDKYYVNPEKPATVSAYGVGTKVKAEAVKNKVDPEGEAFKGINNEILDVWMEDIRSAVGMERLDKLGTAIPYIFNIAGDLLINPSTVSPSTFKKIVESDYAVKAAMQHIINSVINTIGNYVHPDDNIQRHIRVAILKNRRGWRTMLRDILTAIYAGYSRQEKIWDYDNELGTDIIVDTVPLPQNSLIFRVDPYGDLQEEGVGQYVFNSFYPGFSSLFSYGMGNVFAPLLGTGFSNFYPNNYCNGAAGNNYNNGVDPYASLGDMDTPYRTYLISPIGLVWLPTDKTIGFEYYDVTNNKNPYGKSILKSCYNLFVFKYGVLQFFGKALDSKSAPLLIGYARPDVPSGQFNPNNPSQSTQNPSFVPGAPIQDAVSMLSRALSQAKGSSALSLAGMKGEIFDVEAVDIQGELMVFIETLKWIDECILMNLMTPKTVFGSDGKGSYALSYSQADVHARFVMSVRKDLIDCLLHQYIKPMIEEAFLPDEYGMDLGTFDVERTSIDEQVKLSGIYQQQIETGILDITDLEDYNFVRENLGMKRKEVVPSNTKKAVAKMLEKKNPVQKREKLDSTEKPYAHHRGK